MDGGGPPSSRDSSARCLGRRAVPRRRHRTRESRPRRPLESRPAPPHPACSCTRQLLRPVPHPAGWRRMTRMSGARAKATALLAVLQLIVTPAWGQTAALDSLIPARPVGYVNDFAAILDPSSSAALDALVRRLKTATGAEVVVVTLPNIDPYEAADVALAIGRRWKVGPNRPAGDSTHNAGAIVLVVPRQNHRPGTGQVRIETGRGLEGIVTDAAAGTIRTEVMRPYLDREEYGPATLKGVQALAGLIARGYGVSDTTLTAYQPVEPTGGSPVSGNLIPIFFFIVFLVLASGAGGRRRRRRGGYWGGPWVGGGWGGGGGLGGGGGGVWGVGGREGGIWGWSGDGWGWGGGGRLGRGRRWLRGIRRRRWIQRRWRRGKILMRESVARVVEPFLSEVDNAVGQGYSAVLYGSAARGD